MTYPAQGPAQVAQGPALPQIDDPGAIGGVRPRIADLRNRCVIIQPLSIARGVPGVQAGQVQDRITANIFVLDGGPLEFGGKPEKYVPHTLVVATPYLAEGIYISQTNMVSQLQSSLPSPQRPQGGLVVGVIAQGVTTKLGNNPPWNLNTLDPGDPRRQLAANLLQQFFTGGFTNPEPQQTGAPTPAGGALAYTHAVTMPHNAQGQPIPNAAELGQQSYPTQASVSHVPAQVAQQQVQPVSAAPAQDPRYLEWLAGQQQAQAAPAAPAATSTGPLTTPPPNGAAFYGMPAPAAEAPPTGWDPTVWGQLSPEQQAQIRAAQPATAAPVASAQPPF